MRSQLGPELADRNPARTMALLETLQSKAPIGFGFVDRDFRIIRLNEMFASIQGSTVAEQIGRLIPDVVPHLWPTLEPLYRKVLDLGEAVLNVELAGPSPSDLSDNRHWLVSYYPVWLDGAIIGIGIVLLDISERIQAEGVRQQLAAIVEGSGDAIFGSTIDGMFTTWNAGAEKLFGYTAEEVIGQPVSLIATPEHVDEQTLMRARLNAGGPHERWETRRRRKDGTLVDVVISASTATDDVGSIVGMSVIAHDITHRRDTEHELEASRRRLAEAQQIARLGSFELDLVAGEMLWSDELYSLFGLKSCLPGSVDLLVSMVDAAYQPAFVRAWSDATERGIPFDLTCRITRSDAEQRWMDMRVLPATSPDSEVTKLSGTVVDNTEKIEAERVRRAAETRIEIGFEQAGIGVAILGLDGIALRVNSAVRSLLGRPDELLVGVSWEPYNHPDDPSPAAAVSARMAAGFDTYGDERRYVQPDGTVVWASTHLTMVRDESGVPQYFLVQLQDVTERKRMEHELSHQALHDALTGLPNRALLADRLRHGLDGSRRRDSRLGVIFLDVDHFKVVNDSLGHTSGDAFLKQAAGRIAGAVRPGDTVARFGGDEFVIVCDDVSGSAVAQIAERVLTSLSRCFTIDGHQMNVTASAGIALADGRATPESLLRDSDTAMYRAKQRGRGRIEMFDDTLRTQVERRMATAAALEHALADGQFSVHYQPIVDLSTGELISAEALLRWDHPDRGPIGPDEFIPIAEETGMIVEIGAWVLEQACRQVVIWRRTNPSMSVAVNLSVRQMITPDIVGLVESVLRRCGADPSSLCLELTESVFMEDVDFFARTMAGLRALGVRLAIDDFGTGYSSLSYLQRYPVDAVKVDRAFVDGLGHDSQRSGLVAAIIAMAEALGLGVTAEGVETREQLDALVGLRCARAQGYLLARPMPVDEMSRLVEQSYRWSL
jgi:diguanylate cyclase (GGDEF)-like protein/PAS domain S-box-containing protein